MRHQSITKPEELKALCARLSAAPWVAFDTEFVSEHTYRPVLCLVQVAAPNELAAIDPLACGDLAPFWEMLAAPTHDTIVHAGRQEVVFCLEAIGRPPANLFDVQLAAGMVGHEYPSGYGTLISRLLGKPSSKGETRTDWRKRPLSPRQIEYALDDVRHLPTLRERLDERLAALHRMPWFAAEMNDWLAEIDASRRRGRWRKVTGSSSLSGRSRTIVRELWRWREAEAERRDCPTRQVLRDDLIVELAKRRSSDTAQILAIRGMEYGRLRQSAQELSRVIEHAMQIHEDEPAASVRHETKPQLNMIAQFLSAALTSICRDAEVAASLVGTASDVRDLVDHLLKRPDPEAETPALMRGWRAEVVGNALEELLEGKLCIRIADPRREQPLVFEPRTASDGQATP